MQNFTTFKQWLTKASFLTDEDCALFERSLQVKKFHTGDHLVNEGEICLYIGFVNKGCFRTYYLKDGKEINTHFAFEYEFVTDYGSFLQRKPSRYFIEAIENSEIVAFNLSALEDAYSKSKNWERFGRIIAEQSYLESMRRVENFLFMDGKERYLDLVKNQPHILDRIPLYHIASYLGLERESLSRLRKQIKTDPRL
jgi:CRP-like cAMP-binding protein